MARNSESRGIHYLLLAWLLLLTAGQVVFITLYLVAGDSEGGDRGRHSQVEVTPNTKRERQPFPKGMETILEFVSDDSRPITLEASEVDDQGRIHWRSREKQSLVTSAKEVLTLRHDAYYFLCLTVTLTKGDRASETSRTVTVTRNNEVILEGVVNKDTFSTGTLAKLEAMSTWDKLVVSVKPYAEVDMTSPAKTNMGIICLPKPTSTPPARIAKPEK